ncbi:MAG: DNA mismatch repair protein MutS [Bdellovibrionales bacterium]|nr:DNA mismatch repair protein MutS [Bdellovibrionales bacterium]
MTPLMTQYYEIKNQHKDKILFFRMGDFFEMFNEDAIKAAPILNIALTYRNKKSGVKTKMCGVPHHSISSPISKLLAEGLHVAICDQIEGLSDSSGLVKRAVTRILSPGMVYDLDSLDSLSPNYLTAFDQNSISFLDISTGSSFYYLFSDKNDFFKLLNQFQPKEIVLTQVQRNKMFFSSHFNLSLFDKPLPQSASFLDKYHKHPKSTKRLLYYVYSMQGENSLKNIGLFEKRSLNQEMYYSSQLYSHLEIFKNYEGSTKDTLFTSMNRTKTPHGARLLKKRLQSPLIDKQEIEKRWDVLDWWLSHLKLLEDVRRLLSFQGDGERKIGKLVQPQVKGKDLLAVSDFLEASLKVEKLLKKESYPWCSAESFLKNSQQLVDKIKHVISLSCPSDLKQGGTINFGVNPQLDEWMKISKNSQALILEMEQKEQKKLKIPSLKIRYNSISGYYIEIRKAYSSKVPSYYKRKQTLVQAERYMTEELYELEQKILSAKSKQIECEIQIFNDLKTEILEDLSSLLSLCEACSEVDVSSSLAYLSLENKYVRPQLGKDFKLKASRHPVLEQKVPHEFVSNTIELPSHQTVILTGPNMAGKSTLMRQFALTVLMAQTGCFVPADQAELPIFHKMFTRMGASDFLSKGLSTFMVEMKETAEILEQSDSKSFILLDELGRGTATFDGMSLAQAILEFLTIEKKALLFSATHYQELTRLAEKNSSIRNFSMKIKELDGKIHFSYLLKLGPASKSYGIPVARLAGLPFSVLKRAEELLSQHDSLLKKKEKNFLNTKDQDLFHDKKEQESQFKLDSFEKKVLNYPLMTQSPIDALNQIQKWQEELKLRKERVEAEKTL